MTTENETEELELPYPEAEQKKQDDFIQAEYRALLERERVAAEAAQNARLAQIDKSGDISELKLNLRLHCQFVAKYGVKRFTELNGAHIQRTAAASRADALAKKQKQQVSTSQTRLQALNKVRKAQ